MTGMLWIGLVLCALSIAAIGLSAYGGRRWANAMQALQASLEAGRIDDTRNGQSPPARYTARDGLQVPFTGEVAWMRPEGRRPYFVGTVTPLTFEFSS